MIPVLRPHLSRPFIVAAVTALLALHAWLAVSATIDLGVTGDETVHLTGGYSYWRFNDYRLHPENGNLPQRWAALPLVFADAKLDPAAWPTDWRNSDPWMVGQHFFFESGNPIDYLLLCARSMSVVWSVATGMLIFFWSRRLWGDAGGLFALFLFCVSPTTLAHGALVTSDMCATFWILAATGAWWYLTARMSLRRLALAAVALAGASLAKYSSLVLIPVCAAIVIWRVMDSAPITIELPHGVREIKNRVSRLGACVAAAVICGTTTVLAVWASFGFRYSAFSLELPAPTEFFSSFVAMLPPAGALRGLLVKAREWHLLPEAYLQGFAYVSYAARERPAFAAGEYARHGWWWFFPFAILVKSSLAELLALGSLPFFWAFRFLRNGREALEKVRALIPLLIFAAIYLALSLSSHLNIGQRHVLPLYPILFILAGSLAGSSLKSNQRKSSPYNARDRDHVDTLSPAALTVKGSRTRAGVSLVIAALALIESTSIRPDYLAFFNRLAGGPDAGRRLLGDSSLDWGQNLPILKAWLQTHHQAGEPLYLSYFGADDPFYRGIQAIELAPYFSFGRKRSLAPLHGGLYVIGASMLQDAASPYSGPWTVQQESRYRQLGYQVLRSDESTRVPALIGAKSQSELQRWSLERARFARLCLYLRVRRPEVVVGHVFFVYRLTEEEIRIATSGELTELVKLIGTAGRQR